MEKLSRMATNPSNHLQETDPLETQEWLDALTSVIETEGTERAHFLLEAMIDKARRSGSNLPYNATTAYVNTIPTHLQAKLPGDPEMERRVRALVRWNAIMTVLRANEKSPGVGGHIASFQSAATFMTLALIIFSAPQMKTLAAIVFISKAIPHLVCTRAHF
jgi:pyruvate dehydrogenase E1 component